MNFEETGKLFNLAIAREIEANDFYAKAAKTALDTSVRAIFADLAKDELAHMELLERLRADPTLPMKMHKPTVDYKIAEEVDLPTLSTHMKPAEAIALAMLGGILGVLSGWALAATIAAVSPLPARVTGWSVALALTLGAGIGVLFGVYPASRAAKLDPITAMRAET